ncbi:hypothetical protein F5B18DRAFT_324601 [Nemania serpens]|nr:hypothetical protein F5B18DRAFT_324601 [Nemania serpens]
MVEARNTTYGALEHSRLPFDVLLKELNIARSSSHSPLFQVFFDYRQQTSDRQSWCGCEFDLTEMHPGRTAYDISLDVADLGSEVHATLRVQDSLYDLTAANLLLETYTHFIHTLAQDVSISCKDVPIFSEKQRIHATQIGLGPQMSSSWPATLPHRIDEIVQEFPQSIALEDGSGNRLTYSAMAKRVEALAEALSDRNVAFGSYVLVYQQASTDWICSLLAIMRLGAVYVPLDLRNPVPRLASQAEHCQPSAVLVDNTTVKDAPQLKVPVVIDVCCVPHETSSRLENRAQPDAAAAILYTSGSTGTPKGITIRHLGIRNEIEGYTKTYKLGAERVLQQSAFTFDFSMDQIFTALANGGMLYIVPWSQRGDPLSLTAIMVEQRITYTKVTPSEYSMWMQYGAEKLRQASSWRFAFGGGEPITQGLFRQFTSLGLKQLCLYNSYGPAEISIASHKGPIDCRTDMEKPPSEEDVVPCGFSLPNYATYILDESLNPLPPGMPGEIVIGGPGVSFGYLSNPELTRRVFLSNPHATAWHKENGWVEMHRTGDIGHLREDGSLVFRNRVAGDTEVKLHGLRIDLRDIESNILSSAGGVLSEAVVTIRAGDPEYLVAHVVFSSDIHDRHGFLQHLLSRLPIPQYMVPVVAVPLDKLLLTSHSKIDRKAIKDLALPQRADSVLSDSNDSSEMAETMTQLRLLWRRLLPNSVKLGLAINSSTSFFAVGGDSLLVVRLQSEILRAFNVAVRLVDFLDANTLGGIARKIEECPTVDLLDWQLETALPLVPRTFNGSHDKTGTRAKIILITGATGNLTQHLLPLLSANSSVQTIHCVALQNKPRQTSLPSTSKMIFHGGDLALPLLGLSADEFYKLSDQVDLILHLGAARSFWDNYGSLRAMNVHSTRELVKLAAPRRIPIHFMSTSGVLPKDAYQGADIQASAAQFEPPTDGSNGYVATKWASERLLERAASDSELAVPSFIYRLLPRSVVPRDSAYSKQSVQDEFLRCIALAGAVPDCTSWDGRIDLIPADTLAQWLCDSILPPEAKEGDQELPTPSGVARFLHCESAVTVEVDEIGTYVKLALEGGQKYETLPLLKFFGRIKSLGFGFILASQDATVGNGTGKLKSQR